MLSTPTCKIVRVAVAPRTYHHGNLRAALLEEAERALSAGEDLSLRELARRVGVSHAAPRRHFADKQAMLDALASDGFERLGRELAAAMSGPSFSERLHGFARAYVGFATQHAALLELMFAGKQRSEELHAVSDRAFAAPLAMIASAQESGEVVAGRLEEVGTIALAALHGLAAMVNNGMLDPGSLDTIVPAAVERLELGLRPRVA